MLARVLAVDVCMFVWVYVMCHIVLKRLHGSSWVFLHTSFLDLYYTVF